MVREGVEGERGDGPDAVVQAACDPLADDVSGFVGLHEGLVVVHVGNIRQRFPIN